MAPGLVTTSEAATRLGVKRETIYAYVSRGLLAAVRTEGRRGSFFEVAELERFAAARGRREESDRTSGFAIASAVSEIVEDRLVFRGHDVALVVADAGFEQVAELLWTGILPPTVPRWQSLDATADAACGAVAAVSSASGPGDRLRVAVAAAAAADQLRADLRPEAVMATGRSLLRVAASAAFGPSVPDETIAACITRSLALHVAWEPVVDLALALLADHELATSTLAARVAASVRADPYNVALAGLAAGSGSLHGSASALVERCLADAASRGVAMELGERLRLDGRIPGFGHAVYRHGDPRMALLLAAVTRAAAIDLRPGVAERMAVVQEMQAVSSARVPAAPNVDFALGALTFVAGVAADVGEGLFLLARICGWLAHAIEEYAEPPLRFRFRAVHPDP